MTHNPGQRAGRFYAFLFSYFFGTGRRNRTSSTGLETGNQAPKTCVLPLHYARIKQSG